MLRAIDFSRQLAAAHRVDDLASVNEQALAIRHCYSRDAAELRAEYDSLAAPLRQVFDDA